MLRSYGETDFVTGLRAIAATMVICIHTGAFLQFGWLGTNVTEAGKYGVQVFFVISGYTIAATWFGGDGYRTFLIRRLARIAPTYWVVILIAAVLYWLGMTKGSDWLKVYGADLDAYNLFLHVTFLSFVDYRIANSILGVEWSIPIEVFWYVVLPFLLPFTRAWRPFLIGMVALLFAALVTRAAFGAVAPSTAAKWFPTTFGAYFLLGAACYQLRRAGWHHVSTRAPLVMWVSVGLFLLVLAAAPSGGGALIGLATAGLLIARKDSVGRGLWLDSTPLRFLGTISYSLYLWHMVVIGVLGDRLPANGLLAFAIVLAITGAVSTATYLVIERPTNVWGRHLAARFGNRTEGGTSKG
jgi:peptidoglycan/LPS O-acetylase OafA/YrhL